MCSGIEIVKASRPNYWVAVDETGKILPGYIIAGTSFYTFYHKDAWTFATRSINKLREKYVLWYTAFPFEELK